MNDSLNISTDLKMNALYEPEAVAFSFETVGWQILFAVAGVLILVGLFFITRRYIRNAYRRKAVALVQVISDRYNSKQDVQCFTDLMVVLKQVAMTTYGRTHVADLSGIEWLRFLEEKGQETPFSKLESIWNQALYKNDAPSHEDALSVFGLAKKWIKTHA